MAALVVVLGIGAMAWILSNALNATLAFIVVLIVRPAELFPALGVIQPAKLVAFIAILSWLFTKLLHGDTRLSRAPQGKWILALAAGILLSSILGTWPSNSLELFTDRFIKVLIMYGLLVHLVDTKVRATRLHLTFALSTVGLALFAINLKITGMATIEGNRAAFVDGLLGDPNDLALVLLMYVPLFTELVLGTRGIRRLPWGLLLAILAIGILVTVSRGGALGLMIALGFTVYDRGRLRHRLLLAPAIVAVFVGLLVLTGVHERSVGTLNQGTFEMSAQGRLDMWESGTRMVIHNPVFGVGFEQFPDNHMTYARNPVLRGSRAAHNSYIKAAAETGLAGFIPFMALVLLTFRIGYDLRKAEVPEDSPMERAVRRSLLPSMAGFSVAAFFLSQCWSWFFFIMFAQAAVMYEIWKPDVDPSGRRRHVGTVRALDKSVHDEDES